MLNGDQGPRPGTQLPHHQRRYALLADHGDLRPRLAQPLLNPFGSAVQLSELVGLAGDGAEVAQLIDPSVEALVAEDVEGGEVGGRHGWAS